jgi:pimeloyl-ACP methyl ester carboxylesterase
MTGQGTVEVSGSRLSYWCEGSGSPSVLIEQGLFRDPVPEFDSDDWYGWAQAVNSISQFTHVCVYNRRGVPNSDPLSTEDPRTAQHHVDDLVELVTTLQVSEQLVLVGHSWGGLDMQLFSHQNAERVTGLVLVDSSHPAGSDVLGAFRPPSSPEWVDIPQSEAILGDVPDLGEIPVMILTQGRFVGATEALRSSWIGLQDDLLRLSANAERIDVDDAGHLIMIDRPEVIVDAVLTVVEQATP